MNINTYKAIVTYTFKARYSVETPFDSFDSGDSSCVSGTITRRRVCLSELEKYKYVSNITEELISEGLYDIELVGIDSDYDPFIQL